MNKFPRWLPTAVASRAQVLISAGGLGGMEDSLLRLVSDHTMAPVWKALEAQSSTPQQLVDYLEYVRLHQAVMGWPANFLDVSGDAIQRRVFNNVALSCEALLRELEKINPDQEAQGGWGLLEQALQRSELLAAKNCDVNKLEVLVNVQALLQEIQQTSNVVEIFDVIRQAALLAVDAPNMHLPRKRDAVRANIVLLARDVSKYVQYHFRKPLHEVVASTVNAALNLHDEAITADSVRKLKQS